MAPSDRPPDSSVPREKLLSVVVPAYNEGVAVRHACAEITSLLSTEMPDWDFEIVFVDDGSRDDTFLHLTAIAQESDHVRVIRLARNCGSHMAIRAGLEHARGQYACSLSCDLQEPPDLIPVCLESCKSPVEIVLAVRESREDSGISRLAARVFYALAQTFVSPDIPPSGTGMFLLGPKALHTVRQFPERNLTLEALLATMGFAMGIVRYTRRERTVGKSKWTASRKLRLFADFWVANSFAPIRLISACGGIVALLGLCYAVFLVLNKLIFGVPFVGWTSLMVALMVIGGMQMIMLGIIGEYLWRTLDEARRRPRYIVDTILNGHGGEKR